MSVIKKVFDKKIDEEVHSHFLKFSRGEFKDKYLIDGKKQKDRWTIKTGAEFANFLVYSCLKDVKEQLHIKGAIITTLNLGNDEELGFKIKKRSNFQGVKKLEVDTEIEPWKILGLMEKYPRVFFALSFKTKSCELKTKPKAPKSGKPSSKGGEAPKVNFCILKTSDMGIIKDLFFDYTNFKTINIHHTIIINDIIYPKGIEDPKMVREMSKRKGILIRELDIDGKKITNKVEFVA